MIVNDPVPVLFRVILALLPYIPYPITTSLSPRRIQNVCNSTVVYVLCEFFDWKYDWLMIKLIKQIFKKYKV